MKNRNFLFGLLIGIVQFTSLLAGCKKEDAFLAEKPNETLEVPSSLSDYQSLLQNEGLFNNSDPNLGSLAAGEFNVTTDVWLAASTMTERNAYIWAKDIYQGEMVNDWDGLYRQVYTANVVLDGLSSLKIAQGQETSFKEVKGTALFLRAIAFYNLVQTFALPYNKATAGTDLGIPLRLSSDLNIKYQRATEQQCYDQILQDLKLSFTLLPSKVSFITRPNVTAANALLARIYLATGDYAQALSYANACLALNSSIVDYNTLAPADYSLTSSSTYLPEELFHTDMVGYSISSFTSAIVDTTIYQSYDQNDLRKTMFFTIYDSHLRFKGSYDYIQYGTFSGLATDEIYLIRSECNARLGNVMAALADLNLLLTNRYKTGTFVPYPSSLTADQVLQLVINERTKELYYRGLRWTDLRRLNQDDRFKVTLTRTINGSTYSLPANDPRYAYPLPDQEIQLNNLPQNQR
jgi:starch-binding outer membrane protein, SusD/RagB family